MTSIRIHRQTYSHKYNVKLKSILKFLALISIPFLISSCESENDNKLAGAQDCVDGLTDSSSSSQALTCESMVSGMESAQAYLIRCSTRFFVGGITTSKIISAFNSYENAAANLKAATLMDALSQTDVTAAKKTLDACQKSNSPSLAFIATASYTGTSIKTSGTDQNDIIQNLDKCANPDVSNVPQGGVCDDAEIGAAVVAMSDLYCVGEAQNDQVCTEIRSAISSAGGPSNTTAIALALYNLMAN